MQPPATRSGPGVRHRAPAVCTAIGALPRLNQGVGAHTVVIPSERVAVWRLLSELYLDTEHDERALRWLARELARSPYSVPELREIEVWEVAPVLVPNLFAVAGVWDGFDPGWLEAACRRRAARRSLGLRLAARLGWRRFVRRTNADYWDRLEAMILAERAGPAAPAD